MRGTVAKRLRKLSLKYSFVKESGIGIEPKTSTVYCTGYRRFYKDVKKRYKDKNGKKSL